jgi:hypothetical protein
MLIEVIKQKKKQFSITNYQLPITNYGTRIFQKFFKLEL